MASFRKRAGRWQARITRKGHSDPTKTFASKDDARRWARAIECEIDTGSFLPRQCPVDLTLSHLIKRYLSEVLSWLSGCKWREDHQTCEEQSACAADNLVVRLTWPL
jgi:hypothetical protein